MVELSTETRELTARSKAITTLSIQNPTISKFIGALKQLQNMNKNKIEALSAQEPPPQKKKYVDLDARIKYLVKDFENRDVVDFLRGIAHNLEFSQ